MVYLFSSDDNLVLVFRVNGVPVKELEGECQQLNEQEDSSINDRWLKAGKFDLLLLIHVICEYQLPNKIRRKLFSLNTEVKDV